MLAQVLLMASLIVNGGFESGLSGWLVNRGVIVTAPVADGTKALRGFSEPAGGHILIYQAGIAASPKNRTLLVSLRLRADYGTQPYIFGVVDNTGIPTVGKFVQVSPDGVVRLLNYDGTPLSAWTVTVAGSYSSIGFGVQVPAATPMQVFGAIEQGGPTSWFIDDITVTEISTGARAMIDSSKFAGYEALLNRLRGITGPAYALDLGGRVYPRLILPVEGRPKLPYLCVPLIDEAERYEIEQTHVKAMWNVRLYGFVEETASELMEADSVRAVCNLRDDVFRALIPDWTLGGAVRDLTPIGATSFAGEGDASEGYGEFQMVLEIMQMFSQESLKLQAA